MKRRSTDSLNQINERKIRESKGTIRAKKSKCRKRKSQNNRFHVLRKRRIMLIRRVSRMKNLLKRQLHHQAYKRWKHQRELFLIPRRLRVRGLPMIRQRPRINLKRVQRTSTMLRRKMSLQETEKRSLQCSTNFLKKRKINLLSRANKLTKRHQLNSTNTWMKQTTSILAKRKRRK